MTTLDKLHSCFNAPLMLKRERQRVVKAVQDADRRSRADLPSDLELQKLLRKRKQLVEWKAPHLTQKDMAKVLKRIALRDFNYYPPRVRHHLIRYLVHRNETSRHWLFRKGVRWGKYEPGKPRSLFTGKYIKSKGFKRAQNS